MTLREYFTFNCRECDYIENAKISEQIADDYAIDFDEWCLNYEPENIVTSKQLLEIFKKEINYE